MRAKVRKIKQGNVQELQRRHFHWNYRVKIILQKEMLRECMCERVHVLREMIDR